MSDPLDSPGTSLSRRSFLVAMGGVGTTGLAGCTAPTVDPSADETDTATRRTSPGDNSSPHLEKWVDELPRPGVVEPTGTKNGQPRYEVPMRESAQKIHRDLPSTTVWGFDGQFPGPTIEAKRGEPIYVRWQNELPDEHLLPEDDTIHGDIVPYDNPGTRVVTHLHGGNVEAASDGNPQAWFTRGFENTGPEFEKRDYFYVNDQPPATLWYHDHSLGITRLNVYAGLAGLYLIRDEHEQELGLPEGDYEIPLVIQDRTFNEDGSLFYPTGPANSGDDSYPTPSIVPQFYGDTPVVNGTAWPHLSVEPRKYRFRLLNGSNSRFYNLKLFEYDTSSSEIGAEGPPFVLIGNDGGLLSEPLSVSDRLEIGSGQRVDCVVDFTDYAGETLLLHNNAPAMYRGVVDSMQNDSTPLPEILLVDVSDTVAEEDTSQVPSQLTTVPSMSLGSVDTDRFLTLAQRTDDYGRQLFLLGTEETPTGIRLTEPVTEEPTLGDTEIWSISNLTSMSHPIHLHLVHFQVLGRQPSGEYDPASDDIELDALEAPPASERGWNDTITVHPGEIIHVIVTFGEYEGLFNNQTGDYMWHCHMIEHEDHDMMRPLRVVPDSTDTAE